MSGAARRAMIVAASVVTGVALIGGLGVTRVLADTTTLDGLSAIGVVESTPASFWFGQVNRDGICRMISGCVSASGSDPHWVFAINVDVAGAVQTLNVNVDVKDQTIGESAAYAMSFSSPLGSLTGGVDLALRPKGLSTQVTLTLHDMVATGFAQESIPQFTRSLQPVLTSQLAVLSRERVDAGTKVSIVLKAGAKAEARVRVTASSLTGRTPTATGQVRVLIGSKVVCVGKVKKSVGSCRFTPPKRGAVVRAVVTGRLSNGYPVWNSASARYPR